MTRRRLYGIIVIGACLAILVFGFISMGRQLQIRYQGKEVKAIVVKIPTDCDRYNHIIVSLDEREHEVSISRNDCKNGVYKVGQEVLLFKHKNFDELVWPESHPEWLFLLILCILLLAYFTNKKHF